MPVSILNSFTPIKAKLDLGFASSASSVLQQSVRPKADVSNTSSLAPPLPPFRASATVPESPSRVVLGSNVVETVPATKPKPVGARNQAFKQTTSPVEPETNKELRALIDVVTVNSWNNRPWTRSTVRLKHISPAPSVPVGAERVDLKGLFMLISNSIPNHKIAQQLHLHSCALSDHDTDWLLSTLTRLHHLLHVFFVMAPPKINSSSSCNGSSGSFNNELQVQCTCSFKTSGASIENLRPKWDGVLPTQAIATANKDCSLLFLNAFLAWEGQTMLLWLIGELLETQITMTAEQSLEVARVIYHRVGKCLECILKIFWFIQQASSLAGLKLKGDKIIVGECEGMKGVPRFYISATTWIEKEKPLWWSEAAVDEAIRTMVPWGVPEQVSLALMEILIDLMIVPPLADDFNPPTFHIKLFKRLSILPLITTAFLASTFSGLENCLRYFTFLVIQKVDNTKFLLEEMKHITFVMPTMLTGGTTTASAHALRDKNSALAEEKSAGIIRLAVTFLVAVFQLYFQNVDTRDHESHDLMSTFSHSSNNSGSGNNTSSSRCSNSNSSSGSGSKTHFTFSAVLFAAFDALEDTAHTWSKDTTFRVGAILQSLLVRIGKNTKTVKQDVSSFIWESIFQLSFVLEDHVFYSGYSELPRPSPRHLKNFEMRPATANVELVLALQFYDFLSQLEIALQEDEVQRTVAQKKRIELLRSRILEERSFWSKTVDLLETAKMMDNSTLLRDKRYKVVETLSRQRRSHFGDPTLSSKILHALVQVKSSSSSGSRTGTDNSVSKRSTTKSREPSIAHSTPNNHNNSSCGSGLSNKVSHRLSLSDQKDSVVATSQTHDSKEDLFAELPPPQHSGMVDGLDPEHDPSCWKMYADPDGAPLYFNTVTKSLCEEQPACLQFFDPLNDPLCWEAFKDPNGEIFYFNNDISILSYTKPSFSEKLNSLPFDLKTQILLSQNQRKISAPSRPTPTSSSSSTPSHSRTASVPTFATPRRSHSPNPSNARNLLSTPSNSPSASPNNTPPQKVQSLASAASGSLAAAASFSISSSASAPAASASSSITVSSSASSSSASGSLASSSATASSSVLITSSVASETTSAVDEKVDDETGLPPPPAEVLVWREAFDAANGSYFYNRETKETTYDRPTCMALYDTPGLWEETYDHQSKRNYYYNKATKVSTYVQPSCLRNAVVTDLPSERSSVISQSVAYEDGSLEGWREGKDQATGEPYWYNKITRESTFDRPRFMTLVEASWIAAVDNNTKKTYWFNKLTMQSTWVQPASFVRL